MIGARLFALALFCLIATPQAAEAQPAPSRYRGQPISVELQGTNIHSVFKLLAEVSGKQFVVHPSVQATVNLHLRNVPWDQVLEIVLRQQQLYTIEEGAIFLVFPIAETVNMIR